MHLRSLTPPRFGPRTDFPFAVRTIQNELGLTQPQLGQFRSRNTAAADPVPSSVHDITSLT